MSDTPSQLRSFDNPSQILQERGYSAILSMLIVDTFKKWLPSMYLSKEALLQTPNVDNEFDVISGESEENVFLFFLARPGAEVTLTQYSLSSAEIFIKLQEKFSTTKPFIFVADFNHAQIGLAINGQILRSASREAAKLPEHFFILTQFGNDNPIVNKFMSIVDGQFGKDKVHFLNIEDKNQIPNFI